MPVMSSRCYDDSLEEIYCWLDGRDDRVTAGQEETQQRAKTGLIQGSQNNGNWVESFSEFIHWSNESQLEPNEIVNFYSNCSPNSHFELQSMKRKEPRSNLQHRRGLAQSSSEEFVSQQLDNSNHKLRRLRTFPSESIQRNLDTLPNRKFNSSRIVRSTPFKRGVFRGLSKSMRKVVPASTARCILRDPDLQVKPITSFILSPVKRVLPLFEPSKSESNLTRSPPPQSSWTTENNQGSSRRHSFDENENHAYLCLNDYYHRQHNQPHSRVRHFPHISAWAHSTRRPSEIPAGETIANELMAQKGTVEAVDDDVSSCESGALDIMTAEEYLRETAFDTIDEAALWTNSGGERKLSAKEDTQTSVRKKKISHVKRGK